MNQSNYEAIHPGTRVKAGDTTIGTVERLEGAEQGGQPDRMIVRAQDDQQDYNIPLLLVTEVGQGTFNNAVQLSIGPADLAHYQAAPTEMTGTATPSVTTSGAWTGTGDDTLTIPLAAEELVAEKQPIVLGKVRVHKGVETVQQNLTVPVYHEEAIVEHIPVDQYDANAPTGPNDLIIPVTEEQIVVEKRTVVKEYIRIRKNIVTQDQHISDTVRREFVELTEQRQGPTELTLLHYDQGNGTPAMVSAAPIADTAR